MNKPYVYNPKYFIKKKCGFLVAGWIGYKGKELHGDYEYVRSREEGEKLLNDLKKIGMKKQCVRCGLHLDKDQKLWCKKCMERVNEELEGKADRPYQYYFRWNLKHKK